MTTPTSFQGDHSAPKFFVGCEEDEIDDLESNMKAENRDVYDDENDSDSVRNSIAINFAHFEFFLLMII